VLGRSAAFRNENPDRVLKTQEELLDSTFTTELMNSILESLADISISDIVVVETSEQVESACQKILNQKLIALDLEGVDLGKFGKISTIQIATSEPEYQFIFDIVTLGEIPNELRLILQDDKIMKLMFDCRNDSAALGTEYNINLVGIIDLQLKDAMERDDDPDEARKRLHGPLYHRNVEGNPSMYKDVIRLSSLQSALEEHGIPVDESKESIKSKFRSDDQFWAKRPLSKDAIGYAARDATLLFQLAASLKIRTEQVGSDQRLLDASMRYSMVWKSMTPTNRMYYYHPFLLLNILDESNGLTFRCNCCDRDINRTFFSRTAHRLVAKRVCPVCKALNTQAALQKEWDKPWDEVYDNDSSF
jgi:hypothetical protein